MDFLPNVDIFFGTKIFYFSANQTYQLIYLFRIQSLKIYSSYNLTKNNEYWSLIDFVDGKIDLDFRSKNYSNKNNDAFDIINRWWHKITSLSGPDFLFQSFQPSRHFEKISIVYVYTFG
jgi:hypothetical protein